MAVHSNGKESYPTVWSEMPTNGKRRRTDSLEKTTNLLNTALGPEFISTRKGCNGAMLSYLDSAHAVLLANLIFGNENWSSEVRLQSSRCSQEGGKWVAIAQCTVRVTVVWLWKETSSFHEGSGFGGGVKMATEADALEKAVKTAETDALKRALRLFGEATGNCLYDKTFLAWQARVKAQLKGSYSMGTWKVEDLLRLDCNQDVSGEEIDEVRGTTARNGTGRCDPGRREGPTSNGVVYTEDDFLDDEDYV